MKMYLLMEGDDIVLGIFSSLFKAMKYLDVYTELKENVSIGDDTLTIYDVDNVEYRITEWEVDHGRD